MQRGLNDQVNELVDSYFDQDGYPLADTRDFVFEWFVTPYKSSIVRVETLSKLHDVGRYLLEQVIPVFKTDAAAAAVWPAIVWSGVPPVRIVYDTSIFGINGDGSGSKNGKNGGSKNGKDDATDSSDSSGNQTGSGDGGANGSGSGNAKGPTQCNTKGFCGTPCPTSCIDAALLSLSPAPTPAPTASKLRDLSRNLTPYQLSEWWSLFTDSSSASYSSSSSSMKQSSSSYDYFRRQRRVLTEHVDVETPTDDKLDREFMKLINKYFDPRTRIPTQTFEKMARNYSDVAPLDTFHANKLADVIYYVLEIAVNGMPTEMRPAFDFQWVPLGRLQKTH